MYKSREELEQYVDEECYIIVNEPESCHMCGELLVDNEGYDTYYLCEEYPDIKFCSKECIVEYLISMGYVEEE